MCLISVKNKGVELPDKELLSNGYKNNPDGVGVALLKENQTLTRIKKDFVDFEDFYKWAVENINKNDIAIIHFRLATSGKIDDGNRHPFPITQNKLLLRKTSLYCKFAVAHNGILSDYSIKNKKYSDTQKFILDILAGLRYKLDNEAVIKIIRAYIGSDKLSIIDARQRKIILIGSFTNDNGIYWSNSGYKYHYTSVIDKGEYKNIGCDLCDRYKKVKYDVINKMFLCKRCRKKIRKKGLYGWVDELYEVENWEK